MQRLDEGARALVPRVLASLVPRGEDFAAAEDALLEALRVWPEHPPRDPRAWLATVATRRLVDARRSEVARPRSRRTPSRGRPPLHGHPPTPRPPRHGGAATRSSRPPPQVALTPARRRRPHHPGDRRRLLRPGGDDGAADQPGQADPCGDAAWTSPATSPSCCACSTSSTRPVTRAGWTWPAGRSCDTTRRA